ncbi:unnamed protein product [Ambrosiozyma monospora]|uniref:Unnamed protein product n=1 Tax=Ambrosiozyma monospora TaxID=43982 RepID=A0A9W7DHF2_AMBMO|nr:unnamed protein product [Ambrosiozyma monospora]
MSKTTKTDTANLTKQLKNGLAQERRKFMKDTIQTLTKDSKFTQSVRSNRFIAQIDKLSHQMEDYNDDAAQAAAIDVVLSSPVYDRVDKIEESKEGKEDEFDYTDHLL